MLIWDVETSGLLPEMDRIHCLVIKDTETGEVCRYNSAPGSSTPNVGVGIARLETADIIAGHNIIGFDIPAVRKLFPNFQPTGYVLDTLILSRLAYPALKNLDFTQRAKGLPLPGFLIGSHSLKAWGVRLKFPKDDYSDRMKAQGLNPWAAWNQDMEDYCVVDVELTEAVLNTATKHADPLGEAARLEMAVQTIITRQTQRGFRLNERKMAELHATLVDHKLRLESKLRALFPPFYVRDGARDFKPKRDNRKMGYVAGAPLCKVKLVDFNPGSRIHIANRLIKTRGWQPTAFGDDGNPTVDEEVLAGLPWPEAATINEYLMVTKRLGQLFDGKGSVAKFIRNGFVHGEVNTLGTRTGRMSHSKPNVAQTPSVKAGPDGHPLKGAEGGYGWEFRDLYEARPGYVLVGCDADALEMVCLAHFMALWDEGVYAAAVSKGDKSDGTDPHTLNQKAIGLNTRASAKPYFYGLIYGAGSAKLGAITYEDMTDTQRQSFGEPTPDALARLGAASRKKLERNMPALGKFVKSVKDTHTKRGYLKGLDGRKLTSPSAHSAPNTVLQSAGALIMKRALVLAEERLQAAGLSTGTDYALVATVHDELQLEALPLHAETTGQTLAQAITDAALHYKFRCPLAASYDIGASWAETH